MESLYHFHSCVKCSNDLLVFFGAETAFSDENQSFFNHFSGRIRFRSRKRAFWRVKVQEVVTFFDTFRMMDLLT